MPNLPLTLPDSFGEEEAVTEYALADQFTATAAEEVGGSQGVVAGQVGSATQVLAGTGRHSVVVGQSGDASVATTLVTDYALADAFISIGTAEGSQGVTVGQQGDVWAPKAYNDASRQIRGILEVYFDGPAGIPTVINADDYLIDFEVIEEISAEDAHPFGAISANELSFSLANFDNRFSPANAAGPYYDKIQLGVKVEVFVELVDSDIPPTTLGTFFVTEWNAMLGASVASVTCVDAMQDLFIQPVPDVESTSGPLLGAFISNVLSAYGITGVVDAAIDQPLLYGYVDTASTKDLLKELARAGSAYVGYSREQVLEVRKLSATAPVVTFTDDDQLISVDAAQTILKQYDDVVLKYDVPSLSLDIPLFSTTVELEAGVTDFSPVLYGQPVHKLSSISLVSDVGALVSDYTSTNNALTLQVTANAAGPARIDTVGRVLETTQRILGTASLNVLEVSSKYLQTDTAAMAYRDSLASFVATDIPYMELTIRGNPAILPGNTVRVLSNRFAVDYTGFVQRTVHRYDGAYSAKMTLLNVEVLQ